jgi:hypothetical protein
MTLPEDVHPESLSRLPLVAREEMDEQRRSFYDAVTGPQSRTLVGLQGPSGIWLHSPELGARMRAVNQYLRFDTTLDRRLTELAILVTARELDAFGPRGVVNLAALMGNYAMTAVILGAVDQQLHPGQAPLL